GTLPRRAGDARLGRRDGAGHARLADHAGPDVRRGAGLAGAAAVGALPRGAGVCRPRPHGAGVGGSHGPAPPRRRAPRRGARRTRRAAAPGLSARLCRLTEHEWRPERTRPAADRRRRPPGERVRSGGGFNRRGAGTAATRALDGARRGGHARPTIARAERSATAADQPATGRGVPGAAVAHGRRRLPADAGGLQRRRRQRGPLGPEGGRRPRPLLRGDRLRRDAPVRAPGERELRDLPDAVQGHAQPVTTYVAASGFAAAVAPAVARARL